MVGGWWCALDGIGVVVVADGGDVVADLGVVLGRCHREARIRRKKKHDASHSQAGRLLSDELLYLFVSFKNSSKCCNTSTATTMTSRCTTLVLRGRGHILDQNRGSYH